MTRERTFNWDGVAYQSPEYYRLYRLANAEKQREYHRKYDSEMYKKYPEREQARRKRYVAKYPDRVKANQTVKNALASGKLVKQPCQVCAGTKAIAHHDDWSKPLDVIWLCELHHKARHRHLIHTH